MKLNLEHFEFDLSYLIEVLIYLLLMVFGAINNNINSNNNNNNKCDCLNECLNTTTTTICEANKLLQLNIIFFSVVNCLFRKNSQLHFGLLD